MLGVYDSGLGGLTVLRALRAAGITADALYFADGAHVPYGDRSDDEIAGYHRENFARLAELGVQALVMGCNSSCAVAARRGWPEAPFPILDLIAVAAASLAALPHRRLAVVATPTTVRAGAYGRALRGALPGAVVEEIAAPALVPLVESGLAESEAARDAVRTVVAGVPADVEAVVYGCTHYPLLDRWFAAALPPRVARIDPADAQARAARGLVETLGLPPGQSETTFLTSGDADRFAAGVRRWTGDERAVIRALAPLG